MKDTRWIAFELHDGLMQWVIGARMHLAALVASLADKPSAPGDVEETLRQILTYLNQAADEGRQLMRFVEGLPEGETIDVVGTLATTCELLERKAIGGRPEICFRCPEQPWPEMPPKLAWTVVRIIQQAAVNAVRHSGAEHLYVTLSGTAEEALSVVVRDDGCGFDPEGDYPGHFGMQSMRQRARELGLELAIASQPGGGGTTVSLRIPAAALKAAEATPEDVEQAPPGVPKFGC